MQHDDIFFRLDAPPKHLFLLVSQDEDAGLDVEEPELGAPEHILVENAVRNPRIKFFGIPKLGSYLAVPISYSSWLRPGGNARGRAVFLVGVTPGCSS